MSDLRADGLEKTGEAPPQHEPLTPEEDARVRRRIDTRLLPVMAISYLFQFLDKSALSFATLMGILTDLNLKGNDYNWTSSIYYFGYLAASYPAAALMVRLPVGKTISTSVLIWGIVLILTPTVVNFGGILANRFFLGIFEAAIAPGLGAIVSMWYKRSEQPLRQGAWFLGNTLAGMFGNLVAYGIGHIESIPPWKAVFAIFGGITILWAIAMFFLLPDQPATAWFLSEQDRKKAVVRVSENMTGIRNNEIKLAQVVEALTDPLTWFLVVILLCTTIPNGGVANFGPLIIQGLHFTKFTTLLLGSLSYLYQACVTVVTTAGSSYFTNTRTLWLALLFVVSLAGVLMVQHVDPAQRWVRYVGYCLNLTFSSSIAHVMAILMGNVGGFTKKMTINAMIFVAYCVGNIVGPQLFFERERPDYPSGFNAILVCFAVGLVTTLSLRFYLIWLNRCRDKAQQHSQDTEGLDAEEINNLDKTDKQLPQFRYVY